MNLTPNTSHQLTRSPERVRELAEVFTPLQIVCAMVDLLPEEVFHGRKTFLEPCCGDGRILEEVLKRKLSRMETSTEIEMLLCLGDIYGIDICPNNVQATQENLLKTIQGAGLPDKYQKNAQRILNGNIIHADTLNPGEATLSTWKIAENGNLAEEKNLLREILPLPK